MNFAHQMFWRVAHCKLIAFPMILNNLCGYRFIITREWEERDRPARSRQHYRRKLSVPPFTNMVEEQAPKPVGWTMCFLLMTLVPVRKLCVNIYVYIYMCVHSLYEFCYRSYIQRECHSVLARLHPITSYRGMRGSWSECHFVFSLVYQLCLALWSQPNTRMLVTLCICLKQYFDTRYLMFYNTSPPRMFLSLDLLWEYRIQHGATDPFMSHLATQLGYSAGEFQALQLIVLATFGVVD